MRSRVLSGVLVGATLFLPVDACRQVLLPDAPGPPPFPPNLETEVTTNSGLVFRAFGQVVATGPTTLRIRATVTNPTSEEVVAATLAGECQLIVLASWQHSPFLRLVQPLDGGGFTGAALGSCGSRAITRPFAAGETVELTKMEDLVLSDLLGSTFFPGRYVISAIFVDEFIYEALAIDTEVQS